MFRDDTETDVEERRKPWRMAAEPCDGLRYTLRPGGGR